jgi:hypothetical protein
MIQLLLRLVVLLLVLLNGAYFAWSQGYLQRVGLAPEQQTEPERMAQQIKPGALQLLTPEELKQRLTPPVGLRASECLQAGLFSLAQAEVLRSTLAANPEVGTWTLEAASEPGRWIVFMGRYATPDDLARKRAQLAALGLTVEPLTNPDLGLGWSLGHYTSQAAANSALEGFYKRGMRTGRVMQERAEVRGLTLKLNTTPSTVQAQLDALQAALAGKSLVACP